VHALAAEFGLAGFVGNDETGVLIEAEGAPEALTGFVAALRDRPPALAVVTGVDVSSVAVVGDAAFVIAPSTAHGARTTLVSPDTATCADCLRELFDPADRRHRYPFTNCTNCGPRFTIVTGVPYDRAATTMAPFPMCADCAREYTDPADRRFHAQPVCCPACGPRLRFAWTGRADPQGVPVCAAVLPRQEGHLHVAWCQEGGFPDTATAADRPSVDPITAAAAALQDGAVVAVKGLGGYHLAALAADESAVGALRSRKHREDKPFAVLAPDLATARSLAEVDAVEEQALTSRRAPIVLLRRRPGAPLAASVAPGNRYIGVLLPYTPLHHLLAAEVGAPIVLTSGNVSDEPIVYRDADVGGLVSIADAVLTHDRAIHTRADDSVVRVERGRVLPIRRSRGYAPEPLALAAPVRRPMLGCGAELKSTFCLARGPHAFLSHHIGDLENAETLRSFTEGVVHYRRLFDVEPAVVAHDLHPEYLSTKFAQELRGVELVGVQHHHAHLASCLADNGVAGPVIGLACDGLGYGTDGVLWGGEVMEVSLTGFRRLAHLEEVPLPGGTTAIRQPWRMAAAWLRAAGIDGADLAVARRNPGWATVGRLLDSRVGVPATTSVGRLFDAVAALVGVRDAVNYEGQAAIELEQAAVDESRPRPVRAGGSCGPSAGSSVLAAAAARIGPGDRRSGGLSRAGYGARVEGGLLCGSDLVGGVVDDLRAGIDVPVIAARFHAGLADLLARAAADACATTGLDTVALSGGVFQNVLLLRLLVAELETAGLRVLTHSRVPPNDAGVSLGQVAVAAARDTVG
jgi:hydrogenase maturation protein HypF